MISEVAAEEDFNRRDHCLTGAVVAAATVTTATVIAISFPQNEWGEINHKWIMEFRMGMGPIWLGFSNSG